MKRLLLAAGLLLAACGGAEEKAAVTPEGEPAEAVEAAAEAAAVSFNPGEWRMTTRILSVDMPGMPPEVAKQMASRETAVTYCVSEEDARRKPEDMFRRTGDGQCDYQDFDMTDGLVRATMTCTGGAGGGKSTVEMSGRYSENSFSSKATIKVTTGEGQGAMTMSAASEGKRIGDCPAK